MTATSRNTPDAPEPRTEYAYLTESVRARINELLKRYPKKRAVVTQALWVIQENFGAVPLEAQKELADYLEIPPVWIREVMTFYNMYHETPQGEFHVHFCGNLTCSLRGGRKLLKRLLDLLGLREPGIMPDGRVCVERVECLGACEIAPVMQVNGEFVGPLDEESIARWAREALRRTTGEESS